EGAPGRRWAGRRERRARISWRQDAEPFRAERAGQQPAEGGDLDLVTLLAGADHLQVGAGRELVQDLAAGAGRACRLGAAHHHRDGDEAAVAAGHGGGDRDPLGADAQPVGGVLDVGGGDDLAVLGGQGGAALEGRVRGVGERAGGPGGRHQLADLDRAHWGRAWAVASVSPTSAGVSRWMRTRPTRRPWTRSARRRRPWDCTSRPSLGTSPRRLNSRPPIESHSVDGSSTPSSSLTSSMPRRGVTRGWPAGGGRPWGPP